MVSNERDTLVMNAWRWKCGMEEIDYTKSERVDIEALRKSEWSDRLEELMRNRLVLGAMRYGKIHQPGKKKYDRTSNIIERIKAYSKTGNLELLVDAANLCLLEFEESNHPNKHFEAVDDMYHTKEI